MGRAILDEQKQLLWGHKGHEWHYSAYFTHAEDKELSDLGSEIAGALMAVLWPRGVSS